MQARQWDLSEQAVEAKEEATQAKEEARALDHEIKKVSILVAGP